MLLVLVTQCDHVLRVVRHSLELLAYRVDGGLVVDRVDPAHVKTQVCLVKVAIVLWRALLTIHSTSVCRCEAVTARFRHLCRRSHLLLRLLVIVLNSYQLVLVIPLLALAGRDDSSPPTLILRAIGLWTQLAGLISARWNTIAFPGAGLLEKNLLPEV